MSLSRRGFFTIVALLLALLLALLCWWYAGGRTSLNKPISQQNTDLIEDNDPSHTCDTVWIREGGPRDISKDVITAGDNRIGPNIWGNSRDTALVDITRGLCLSKTLLHDVEGLLRVGYDFWEPEDVRTQHVNEIGYTTDAERAAWSTRVATAVHWLKIRFVRFQYVSESNSWFYGDKSGPVPSLMKDRKARPSVIFVITQHGDRAEGIDLECI